MARQFHPRVAERIALIPSTAHTWDDVDPTVYAQVHAPYGPLEQWQVDLRDIRIDGPNGPVPIRIYTPDQPGPDSAAHDRPALVWMHGGGFVHGDLEMPEANEVARGLAGRAGAVVISVDYRLCSDEVHFPVPHEDVLAAYRWTLEHADDLGIDPGRLAIGGASAGANLAAGAALALADAHAVDPTSTRPPRQALLSYPVVHAPLPPPSSELQEALEVTPTPMRFLPETTAWMAVAFLGTTDADAMPKYAMVGVDTDLSNFPPTFIDNDEFDDLRASGELFAQQLSEAGVEVTQHLSGGVGHGHLNLVGLDVTHASLDLMADRLARF